MRKQTRSILEELNNLHRVNRGEEFIQTTGINIIESAINLLGKINETYSAEQAADLEKRFLNSIRSGNSRKFKTGVDKIRESKR
jgi:hypothetical protein